MKTIEFFSTVAGLADVCPVIPANKYKPNWMSAAKNDYLELKKSNIHNWTHIYQCPGIFDLFNYGYIIPMWHDVVIKTNGDKENFQFLLPTPDLTIGGPGGDVVGRHLPGIDSFLPKKPWAIDPTIKFHTPWKVIAPKGVKFLVIPIAYSENPEIESSIGILDPGYSCEINFQMYFNIIDGEYLLKAGTPMLHMIPLSEEKFNFICRDANDHDIAWLRKKEFFKNFTFKLKRNVIKEFYYKHFKG